MENGVGVEMKGGRVEGFLRFGFQGGWAQGAPSDY